MRQGAERLAINTPVQSTAADLIKKAMITIHDKLLAKKMQSRMVLQIHDELLFEAPTADADRVAKQQAQLLDRIVKVLDTPMDNGGGTLNLLRKGFSHLSAKFQNTRGQLIV